MLCLEKPYTCEMSACKIHLYDSLQSWACSGYCWTDDCLLPKQSVVKTGLCVGHRRVGCVWSWEPWGLLHIPHNANRKSHPLSHFSPHSSLAYDISFFILLSCKNFHFYKKSSRMWRNTHMRRMINGVQVMNLCVTRDAGGLVPMETPHNLHAIFKQLKLCRKSALSLCHSKYEAPACKPWVSHVLYKSHVCSQLLVPPFLATVFSPVMGQEVKLNWQWPRGKAVCKRGYWPRN